MHLIMLKPLLDLIGIENSPQLPRVLKNAAWLLFDGALRLTIGLFVVGWTARYLGPMDFGILSYSLAFVLMFTLFASFGLNEVVVRNIITASEDKNQTLAAAFILRLLAGLAALITCLSMIYLLRPQDPLTHAMVGIISVSLVFQAFDVIDSYFQSQLQVGYTVLAKSTAFILMSLVKIFLIIHKAPLPAFAIAYSLEMVLVAVGLFVIYRSLAGGALKLSACRLSTMRQIVMSCWPIWVSGIAAMIPMRLDQVLLRHFKGASEVGIYAAAFRISEIWYLLGVVIIISAFPVLARLKKEDEGIYRLKLKQLYKVLGLVALSASLITILCSGFIIMFLYGPAYIKAVPVLCIHVLGVGLVYLGGATTYALVVENLQKYHLFRTALGCLSNLGLNLYFIPRWGAMGAALAMLISYTIGVYSIMGFKKAREIF